MKIPENFWLIMLSLKTALFNSSSSLEPYKGVTIIYANNKIIEIFNKKFSSLISSDYCL